LGREKLSFLLKVGPRAGDTEKLYFSCWTPKNRIWAPKPRFRGVSRPPNQRLINSSRAGPGLTSYRVGCAGSVATEAFRDPPKSRIFEEFQKKRRFFWNSLKIRPRTQIRGFRDPTPNSRFRGPNRVRAGHPVSPQFTFLRRANSST